MENPNTNIEMYGKFTWTINDFSTVMPDLSSDPFSFDGHKWRIIMDYVSNSLSIYLDSAVDNMPHGWEKTVNYNLILINQLQAKRNIINECNATFHSNSRPCGFEAIDLNKLWDSSCGFIVDDTCIVEVHIKVEKEVDESVRNVDNKLVERIQNLPPQEMISTEMVDFRGIGKVEKDFIFVLEEVCLRYPSLIDSNSKKRKSKKFIGWAFTALGRVLHFLKTKRMKDMDNDNCNNLQTLWEELETFGFDLTWLKPHVQYALSMKTRVEKVLEVKRLEEYVTTLKENVSTLEENVTSLKEKTKALKIEMIEAKVNLEIATRDLVKTKDGFEDCDMDAELGYGGP